MTLTKLLADYRAAATRLAKAVHAPTPPGAQAHAERLATVRAAQDAHVAASQALRQRLGQRGWESLIPRLRAEADALTALRAAKRALYTARETDRRARQATDKLIKEWERDR